MSVFGKSIFPLVMMTRIGNNTKLGDAVLGIDNKGESMIIISLKPEGYLCVGSKGSG
jgi:hypothetical protein